MVKKLHRKSRGYKNYYNPNILLPKVSFPSDKSHISKYVNVLLSGKI